MNVFAKTISKLEREVGLNPICVVTQVDPEGNEERTKLWHDESLSLACPTGRLCTVEVDEDGKVQVRVRLEAEACQQCGRPL